MKKHFALLVFLFLLEINYSSAQIDTTKKVAGGSVNIGLGLGIDYGGIGTRFTVVPNKNGFLFLALGYNIVGLGINAGAGYLILPDKRTCPYLIGMYGYNAVIVIENASKYDEIYYGPSFGIGVEFINRRNKNFWNLELLLPVRPKKYDDDLNKLKHNPSIRIESEPPPIGFSVGFHFG